MKRIKVGGFISFVPLNIWAGHTEIPKDADLLESHSPGHLGTPVINWASFPLF